MDELRAAESIRYLANQYANMVFVAEQLEKIGSLDGQIKSMLQRYAETEQTLLGITAKVHDAEAELKRTRAEHDTMTQELADEYAKKCQAIDQDLVDRQNVNEAAIQTRAEEAERAEAAALAAHQEHVVELNRQLEALGARIAAATKEAEAAEARRDHAQELLNRVQASIAAIKLEGAGV